MDRDQEAFIDEMEEELRNLRELKEASGSSRPHVIIEGHPGMPTLLATTVKVKANNNFLC